MKKKAFTLAETLITLGIIGVIAAVLVPFMHNMKPDTNKMMYLKSYDALAKNVKNLVRNSSIYSSTYKNNGKTYDIDKIPLLDFNVPNNPSFQTAGKYRGVRKFGDLLQDALGGKSVPGHDIGNHAATFEAGYNFTTSNGVQWWIQPSSNPYNSSSNNVIFYNKISIDVNGDEGPNMYYSAASSQTPDRFDFYITAAGKVIPADAYGQMYIDRRRNFLKRKEDMSGYGNLDLNNQALLNQLGVPLTGTQTTDPSNGVRGNDPSNATITEPSNGGVTNQNKSNGSVTNQNNSNGSTNTSNGGSSSNGEDRDLGDGYPDWYDDYDYWDGYDDYYDPYW